MLLISHFLAITLTLSVASLEKKKCEDATPEQFKKKGIAHDCEELYGEVIADGGSCSTDLGQYDPKLKKYTLDMFCCATCNPGPPPPGGNTTVSPIVKECENIDHVCSNLFTNYTYPKCWKEVATGAKAPPCKAPNDKTIKKKDLANCQSCIAGEFGTIYYGSCSCCMLPLLKDAGVELADDKALPVYFPCSA